MEQRRWRRNLRAAGMLLRNMQPPNKIPSQSQRRSTPCGVSYDLYEPEGEAESTHIVLYGMDYAGEKDVRLVRFANAYTAAGIRVIAPDLPGLKSFQSDVTDLHKLTSLTKSIYDELGTPIRYTAFSFGASLGLVAIAQPDLSEMVDLVLLFGPYYSLADLWDNAAEYTPPDRGDSDAWESFIWLNMAVTYNRLDTLDLTKEEHEQFLDLLQYYCVRKSEMQAFYDSVLTKLDLADFTVLMPDERTMEILSPAGKLCGVKARVLILHDPYDPVMPPEHAEYILDELCQRDGSKGQRLLVTPLLTHIRPRATLQVADLFNILDMFGELFT